MPCSACTHSPLSDSDSIDDKLKDLRINHVELSHTKGIHYDIIVCGDGSHLNECPEFTFCM